MFYIFANLAQLIKRMQSTRHTTAHRLNDDLGRQQILRERIFCKLSNTFEQFGPPFTACRGWPPLRTAVQHEYYVYYGYLITVIQILRVRTLYLYGTFNITFVWGVHVT